MKVLKGVVMRTDSGHCITLHTIKKCLICGKPIEIRIDRCEGLFHCPFCGMYKVKDKVFRGGYSYIENLETAKKNKLRYLLRYHENVMMKRILDLSEIERYGYAVNTQRDLYVFLANKGKFKDKNYPIAPKFYKEEDIKDNLAKFNDRNPSYDSEQLILEHLISKNCVKGKYCDITANDFPLFLIDNSDTYEYCIENLEEHKKIKKKDGNKYLITARELSVNSATPEYITKPIDELKEKDIENIIKSGEGNTVEFKLSLRWDLKLNKVNKDLTDKVIKTIAAFANTNGGLILIGVHDSGDIKGIPKNFEELKTMDNYQKHIDDRVQDKLGNVVCAYKDQSFFGFNGKNVLMIRVRESKTCISYDNKDIIVRRGVSNITLSANDAIEYGRKWRN